MTRLGGFLAIGGFAATLWYFFGYLGSIGWGPPGTDAYVVYERANRLASVPLLVHVTGWTLLVCDHAWRRVAMIGALGSLMMLAGNVGEFWIFSGASYASAARNVSWTTFLLGTLVTVVGFVALAVRRLVVRAAARGRRADDPTATPEKRQSVIGPRYWNEVHDPHRAIRGRSRPR